MFNTIRCSVICAVFAASNFIGFTSALAEDSSPSFAINELRFGGLNHDPVGLGREMGGLSVAAEILFTSFNFDRNNWSENPIWEVLVRPRLHVGGYLNTRGKTNYIYSGLTWRAGIGPVLFVEGTFGAAIHDGYIGTLNRGIASVPGTRNRAALGLRVLFRESISIGLQINEKFSVIAGIEHLSHGSVVSQINNGLTNYGVKIGYKF